MASSYSSTLFRVDADAKLVSYFNITLNISDPKILEDAIFNFSFDDVVFSEFARACLACGLDITPIVARMEAEDQAKVDALNRSCAIEVDDDELQAIEEEDLCYEFGIKCNLPSQSVSQPDYYYPIWIPECGRPDVKGLWLDDYDCFGRPIAGVETPQSQYTEPISRISPNSPNDDSEKPDLDIATTRVMAVTTPRTAPKRKGVRKTTPMKPPASKTKVRREQRAKSRKQDLSCLMDATPYMKRRNMSDKEADEKQDVQVLGEYSEVEEHQSASIGAVQTYGSSQFQAATITRSIVKKRGLHARVAIGAKTRLMSVETHRSDRLLRQGILLFRDRAAVPRSAVDIYQRVNGECWVNTNPDLNAVDFRSACDLAEREFSAR